MKRSNVFLVILVMLFSVVISGCTQIENIPAGYVAKMLTPTGWDEKIYEAGQVDIGQTTNNGQGNTLVLLEASSVMIKESFKEEGEDGQDHRVKTLTESLAVDAYVNVILPDDPKIRNSIFALVTPAATKGSDRVKVITLEMVYRQFAQMDVRSKTRSIFSKYRGI
jgi:hypothetical protein